jgi:hypothetical protein
MGSVKVYYSGLFYQQVLAIQSALLLSAVGELYGSSYPVFGAGPSYGKKIIKHNIIM